MASGLEFRVTYDIEEFYTETECVLVEDALELVVSYHGAAV